MPDARLTGLDFVRALACLLVVAHHTTQRLNFDALSGGWRSYYLVTNMGAFGVAVFFLLSGFLLSRPFWVAYDAARAMPNLGLYALRRAARIVPGYYVALSVSLTVACLVFGTPFDATLFMRYLSGLLFINAFHWLTLFPTEVNGPLWSIGMEVVSYALLPFAMLALFAMRGVAPAWKGRLIFALLVAVALLAHVAVTRLVPKDAVDAGFDHGMTGGARFWMPEFNVAGFFAVFALGGLAAGISTLWKRRSLAADLTTIAGFAIAAAALWSAAPARLPEAFGWLGLPYAFPWFHLGVAVMLLALPSTSLLPRITEARLIRFIARISFGIYIWHFLVLELCRQLLVPSYGWGGMSDTGSWLGITAACLIVSVAAGALSWRFIEAPALAWTKRLESRIEGRVAAAHRQKLHA